ncbi:MAG TPA: S53 family peptidase [Ktedonobacteraceae bacterium]|nr:S53 family peptidase [Ktedonobacteraceae bacterium]
MKKRCLSIGLTALSILSIFMLTLSTVHTSVNVSAASPPPKVLAGTVPSAVLSGQARLIGHHPGTDKLALTVGLPLRNQQALTQLFNKVSTPRNPQYRHYLTLTQENQAFNPTSQQEQQVIGWLESHRLTVTHTYPNHLLVDVTGTFAQIERMFHVTINDYIMQFKGKQTTFYAPANEPTIDGSVGGIVDSVLGLDDYPSFQVNDSLALTRPAGNPHGSPPYYPQDFANAYDVNPLWNAGDTGHGQHIAIILPGTPPIDATLIKFANQTGSKVATQGNKRLKVIPVDGGSTYRGGQEAGIDVESASGMAPKAIIDYYEMPGDNQNGPTSTEIDDALNLAGSDPYDALISNSWTDGGAWTNNCEPSKINSYITTTEEILAANSMTGHDYFFASGDNGSACVFNSNSSCSKVQDPYPSYPASSAYVTSVGGTNLAIQNNSWQSEVAWDYIYSTCFALHHRAPPSGSGGGYSNLFPEPTWQSGIPDPSNHRGYPDIAADADFYTGAFICYTGKNNSSPCIKIGGTSLATPLWAGMMADVNQYVQSQGGAPLGFINPLLYKIANGSPYTAYHDIVNGSNGNYYSAGPGWDAVTGLGSPDLYNLAQDAASLDASNASSSQLLSVAAVSANDVWAVGYSDIPNRGQLSLIEQWNGTSWSVVPSPNPSPNDDILSSVAAVSANDIWAVGNYYDANGNGLSLIEQWNGTSWSVVPSPNPPSQYQDAQLFGVTAVSANDVWAVGIFKNSSDADQTLIEQWNGTNWNVVPSPSPSPCIVVFNFCNILSSVAAVSANDVWAVGYYEDSSGHPLSLIEQWNGTNWNVVPGSYGTIFSGVTTVSANDVWAVGSDYSSTQIEQWDGTNWNMVPSPSPGSSCGFCNILSSVTAVSANDIWAVGYYEDSSGHPLSLIEQWNGTSWSVVPSPNPSPYINYLFSVTAVSANDVWAVGGYLDSNRNYHTLAEQWNGTTWNVVPSP